MSRKLLFTILGLFTVNLIFIACEREEPEKQDGIPTISITTKSVDYESMVFKIDVENSETVYYLFSEDDQKVHSASAVVENGTPMKIKETVELTKQLLEKETSYRFTAVAVNDENMISEPKVIIETTQAGSTSLTLDVMKIIEGEVEFNITTVECSECYYLISKDSGLNADMIKTDGKSIEVNKMIEIAVNNLIKDTKYIIYIYATDRIGEPIQIIEKEITTSVQYITEDYVGDAVLVNGEYWAPVNCGFSKNNNPYGKLYQWGRIDGQGYEGEINAPLIVRGPINYTPEAEIFYTNESNTFNWIDPPDDFLWSYPKTKSDPCPLGWRIPSKLELITLGMEDIGSTTIEAGDKNATPLGQAGRWFGKRHSEANVKDNRDCIFLPYSGGRMSQNNPWARDEIGYYWSYNTEIHAAQYLILYDKRTETSVGNVNVFPMPRASGFSVRCILEKDLS